MATAGIRMMAKQQQDVLLSSVCAYLRSGSEFRLDDCKSQVQVISGETEGVYGWLAANYLLDRFRDLPDSVRNDARGTYGFLDMGGASAQIVYAPNSTEATRHADDLKLIRLRSQDGSAREYKVFAASFLGFGANTARQRYNDALIDQYFAEDSRLLPDPCLPHGLQTNIHGDILSNVEPTDNGIFQGTGNFPQCLRLTRPLLRKEAICKELPCLFDGKHAPALDFQVNRFVGISEYWHLTHGLFKLPGPDPYNLLSYQTKVEGFCSRDWREIEIEITRGTKNKHLDEKLRNAQEACFKASWLINLLHEGIGIPKINVAPPLSSNLDPSLASNGTALEQGLLDLFKPVNKVDGVELSWTLGHILLYASSRIRPKFDDLAVGFGQNIPGLPLDFEYPSPSTVDNPVQPDSASTKTDPLSDTRTPSIALLTVFLSVMVLVWLLLRRRERRALLSAKVISVMRRYRRRCSLRSLRLLLPFARDLARDDHGTYDAILEEGTFEYRVSELDGDNADDLTPPHSAVSSGVLTAKKPPDWRNESPSNVLAPLNDLIARSESIEHLATPVQAFSIGRRSRAGSPTRGKA